MSTLTIYVQAAFLSMANIYGYGEMYCGSPAKPAPCQAGAPTASGLIFHPDALHVAVYAPPSVRIPGTTTVCIKALDGHPVYLPVTDKKGKPGFDLSPAAVSMLGYTPTPYWSARLEACK
jgi:hypothetical protein